jgi:hypothetical protein
MVHPLGASQFFIPHPFWERDFESISPLPFWEKGLGDEGKLEKLVYHFEVRNTPNVLPSSQICGVNCCGILSTVVR